MKLISLLEIMDDSAEIMIDDENAPIDEMTLFHGTVEECKQQSYFRNGVITAIHTDRDVLYVLVNIEYQKKKGGASDA